MLRGKHGRSTARRTLLVPLLAALAVLVPLAWMWQSSRVPKTYSVMDMGQADWGGGPADLTAHAGHSGHPTNGAGDPPQLVTDLIADSHRTPDVRVELVAARQRIRIGDREIDGFTLNGSTPGPQIRARQGQLIEVHLRNASVAEGTTLHWHGLDVPNAMDGVAGVTQDAVPIGGEFVYRFVAQQVGSFWYHAHQVSNAQVIGGLFGSLVIDPATSAHRPSSPGPATVE